MCNITDLEMLNNNTGIINNLTTPERYQGINRERILRENTVKNGVNETIT